MTENILFLLFRVLHFWDLHKKFSRHDFWKKTKIKKLQIQISSRRANAKWQFVLHFYSIRKNRVINIFNTFLLSSSSLRRTNVKRVEWGRRSSLSKDGFQLKCILRSKNELERSRSCQSSPFPQKKENGTCSSRKEGTKRKKDIERESRTMGKDGRRRQGEGIETRKVLEWERELWSAHGCFSSKTIAITSARPFYFFLFLHFYQKCSRSSSSAAQNISNRKRRCQTNMLVILATQWSPIDGRWLWHSWQGSYFRIQRTWVRIQWLAIFIEL